MAIEDALGEPIITVCQSEVPHRPYPFKDMVKSFKEKDYSP